MPLKNINNVEFEFVDNSNCPHCERYKTRIAELEAIVSAMESYLVTIDTRNQIKYKRLTSRRSDNSYLMSIRGEEMDITRLDGADPAL